MQPGLPEAARNVEADPGAVFDAHGAESVDELVASGESSERDTASDRAVIRLFEGELDRPERRGGSGTDDAGSRTKPGESVTTPPVLADLERAIDASEGDDPGALSAADLDLDDRDVADALAAAEELDDGELPASVPAAWRDP